MSHQKQQISIQQVTRLKVMQMLGMSEQEYGEAVMDAGYAYLNQIAPGVIADELEKSDLFWAWWRNHWHSVDMDFVADAAKNMSTAERRIYYGLVHERMSYKPQRAILMDALKKIKTPVRHIL